MTLHALRPHHAGLGVVGGHPFAVLVIGTRVTVRPPDRFIGLRRGHEHALVQRQTGLVADRVSVFTVGGRALNMALTADLCIR